jgi:hypothetical protein
MGGGGAQNTYLAFNEVSNASLGHDGNGNGLHDLLDHAGVGHAGDATLDADISGDTLESHDGGGTGLLSNTGLKKRTNMSVRCNYIEVCSRAYLLRIDDVHDHTTLQHLGQTGLDGEVIGGSVLRGHCERVRWN